MASYQEHIWKISIIERKLEDVENETERIRNDILNPQEVKGSKSADNLNDTLEELLKRINVSRQMCASAKRQLRKD